MGDGVADESGDDDLRGADIGCDWARVRGVRLYYRLGAGTEEEKGRR
jgi:hypothetical protein